MRQMRQFIFWALSVEARGRRPLVFVRTTLRRPPGRHMPDSSPALRDRPVPIAVCGTSWSLPWLHSGLRRKGPRAVSVGFGHSRRTISTIRIQVVV